MPASKPPRRRRNASASLDRQQRHAQNVAARAIRPSTMTTRYSKTRLLSDEIKEPGRSRQPDSVASTHPPALLYRRINSHVAFILADRRAEHTGVLGKVRLGQCRHHATLSRTFD